MSDRISPYVDIDLSSKMLSNQHSGGTKTMEDVQKITVHCMDGYGGTGEGCVMNWVNAGSEVSANYCIGENGDVARFVPEELRAHTSASHSNDFHAITIEVANTRDHLGGTNYENGLWKPGKLHGQVKNEKDDPSTLEMCPSAYNKLILVCADICKRYNINLYYDGTPSGTLTCHWMFVGERSCPGGWFMSKIPEFVKKVNTLASGGSIDFDSDSDDDDWDDENYPVPTIIEYDYYLITSTEKSTKPGECGNKITGSVHLGRW